jgi:hypothetical protein
MMGVPAVQLPAAELEAANETAATALTLPEQARAMTITDADSFEGAGAFLVEIKRRRQAIVAAFEPVVQAGLRAHREALALQKQADAPCLEAETVTKQAMAAWQREQERLRLEADAEAERKRIAEAEAALEAGDDERAELILETPAAPVVLPDPEPLVPAAVVIPETAKATGVSFRKVYKHRVVNRGAIKAQFLVPDEKAIGATVRALGLDAVAVVGGIEVFEDISVAARTR